MLRHKAGLTVEELATEFHITRNAVRQHLSALENINLIRKGVTRASGGRPEQLYVLTDQGKECFPRHYDWFAQLLIESVMKEVGADDFGERLKNIGTQVGQRLSAQHPDLISHKDKVQKLAELLDQLGYDAKMVGDNRTDEVAADNCVFHALALKNPAICEFDLALLSTFTEGKVEHQECMAKGGNSCRFKFTPIEA